MKHLLFTIKEEDGKYVFDQSFEYTPPLGMGPEQLRSFLNLNASDKEDVDKINGFLRDVVTDFHTLKIKLDSTEAEDNFGIAYVSSKDEDIKGIVESLLAQLKSGNEAQRWMRNYSPKEV